MVVWQWSRALIHSCLSHYAVDFLLLPARCGLYFEASIIVVLMLDLARNLKVSRGQCAYAPAMLSARIEGNNAVR